MSEPREHRPTAEEFGRLFDAAAGHYDDLGFWLRFGERTVDRLGLAPGAAVLDVCCGSGASALHAARVVGPEGTVLGLDVSEGLLGLARAKARAEGLGWARFARGDLGALEVPDEAFDAVVCVFGVFFVEDMEAALARLWRAVRPGGALAVTTWGADPFEPAVGVMREVVAAEAPERAHAPRRSPRTEAPEAMVELLVAAGAPQVTADLEPGEVPLRPEDWWTVVLGSAARGIVDPLDEATRTRLRIGTEDRLRAMGLERVRADVVYAAAGKERDPRPVVGLEDLVPGRRFAGGTTRVTADEVVGFARRFDPQPFHLDPGAGAASVFGAQVASGWHTAALTMRLFVDHGPRVAGGLVGLGVDEVRWQAVRPGDALRMVAEVVEVIPSRSRPDRGRVRMRLRTLNQRDEEVQHLVATLLVPRRPAEA